MKIAFLKSFLFLILILIPFFSAQAIEPVKILLVPGHDDEVWGAQYGKTKEADMNLALATNLYKILKKDERFEVYITREKGGYTKEFEDYFSLHQDEILAFRESAKLETQNRIKNGSFMEKESVPHINASEDVSIRLYGFNKWANENKIDAVIHIHFNDYPRPSPWTVGKHKGFSIYMPDNQFGNSLKSGGLAVDIFSELNKKYITSTYKKEKGGLIADQKLIALGSNGTLLPSVLSVLIEYGYIYRFKTNASRERACVSMAQLTAVGIKNNFFPK